MVALEEEEEGECSSHEQEAIDEAFARSLQELGEEFDDIYISEHSGTQSSRTTPSSRSQGANSNSMHDSIDPDGMEYEELLHLVEAIDVENRGISESRISQLPTSKYRYMPDRIKSGSISSTVKIFNVWVQNCNIIWEKSIKWNSVKFYWIWIKIGKGCVFTVKHLIWTEIDKKFKWRGYDSPFDSPVNLLHWWGYVKCWKVMTHISQLSCNMFEWLTNLYRGQIWNSSIWVINDKRYCYRSSLWDLIRILRRMWFDVMKRDFMGFLYCTNGQIWTDSPVLFRMMQVFSSRGFRWNCCLDITLHRFIANSPWFKHGKNLNCWGYFRKTAFAWGYWDLKLLSFFSEWLQDFRLLIRFEGLLQDQFILNCRGYFRNLWIWQIVFYFGTRQQVMEFLNRLYRGFLWDYAVDRGWDWVYRLMLLEFISNRLMQFLWRWYKMEKWSRWLILDYRFGDELRLNSSAAVDIGQYRLFFWEDDAVRSCWGHLLQPRFLREGQSGLFLIFLMNRQFFGSMRRRFLNAIKKMKIKVKIPGNNGEILNFYGFLDLFCKKICLFSNKIYCKLGPFAIFSKGIEGFDSTLFWNLKSVFF
ncbi:hypothetical protein LXL04_004336 [Taraxacum kok-saghyz]